MLDVRTPHLSFVLLTAEARIGQWGAFTGGWSKTGLYFETVRNIFEVYLYVYIF